MRNLMGEIVILNSRHAVDYVKRVLSEKYGYVHRATVPENFNRHYTLIMYDPILDENKKIYVAYQRNWFVKFPKYFGVDEQAVSINMEILHRLVLNQYTWIIWINQNAETLCIDPLKAYNIVVKNKWYHRTKRTNEIVAHIPLSKLYPL